jgi:hypothetical protein
VSYCVADDCTECDCDRCRGADARWEREQGWDDSGLGEACWACGEPQHLGCDPACSLEGERLRAYIEAAVAEDAAERRRRGLLPAGATERLARRLATALETRP